MNPPTAPDAADRTMPLEVALPENFDVDRLESGRHHVSLSGIRFRVMNAVVLAGALLLTVSVAGCSGEHVQAQEGGKDGEPKPVEVDPDARPATQVAAKPDGAVVPASFKTQGGKVPQPKGEIGEEGKEKKEKPFVAQYEIDFDDPEERDQFEEALGERLSQVRKILNFVQERLKKADGEMPEKRKELYQQILVWATDLYSSLHTFHRHTDTAWKNAHGKKNEVLRDKLTALIDDDLIGPALGLIDSTQRSESSRVEVDASAEAVEASRKKAEDSSRALLERRAKILRDLTAQK